MYLDSKFLACRHRTQAEHLSYRDSGSCRPDPVVGFKVAERGLRCLGAFGLESVAKTSASVSLGVGCALSSPDRGSPIPVFIWAPQPHMPPPPMPPPGPLTPRMPLPPCRCCMDCIANAIAFCFSAKDAVLAAAPDVASAGSGSGVDAVVDFDAASLCG